MRLPDSIAEVRLIRRYKRFLADMEWPGGEITTVHCPNTGSMAGCQAPGARAWVSHSEKPGRKYAWTWELVEAEPDVLVGIHTGRTNGLVAEAVEAGGLPGLEQARLIRKEYRPPGADSRFDMQLEDDAGVEVLVEVKNVTAAFDGGLGYFPDAVSVRAKKHVRELARLAGPDCRVVLCFCVQREDVHTVQPATHIDPGYAEALAEAMDQGLEVIALGCSVSPAQIRVRQKLEFSLNP